MDILFENSYTRTKELAQEIYKYLYFQRPMYIVFDIIIGLSFIANIASCMINHYPYSITAMILAIVFFDFQFLSYFKAVKATAKRDNELTGGNGMNVKTIVTNEFIRNSASTGSVNEIPFTKIKKVIQTKNLILLRSEAKLIYIFRKDTFTKGSADEFLLFLKTKGISK